LNLSINLDTTIRRDHIVGNGYTLMDRNALIDNSIVLHVGHAEHSVNLGDTQPVQDIWHQSLEAHVLDTGNILSALEVLAGTIFASLSGVVDEVFGDLAKSTAFLTEVDDNTAATLLGLFDCFFNTESQVGTACADVRSEYVTSVAFVVDTEGELRTGVGHLCWVTEDVDC